MALEHITYHERILKDCTIAEPNCRWQWCEFIRCTINVCTEGQTFHQCTFINCVEYPPRKK